MFGKRGQFGWWMACALGLLAACATAAPPTTRTVRVFAPAPASRPSGRSIPGITSQFQAETRIKQIYASDYADTSFNGRRTLAKRLIEASSQTQSDWDAKFVLLREARTLAAAAGDVTTAFEAIDLTAREFPVIKLYLRAEALDAAMPMLTADNSRLAGASMCMDLVDQAMIEGEYERVDALLGLAGDAARKAKSKPYFEWIEARSAAIRPLREAWEVAKPAKVALSRAPDDPAANLVAGTFVTFVKGDFETGLPMLAKSGDEQLASLAQQDLSTPADRASLQLKSANGWWEYAESQPVDYRSAIRRRAGYWYRKAQSHLDGLDRALAQRRLQELAPPRKKTERTKRPPDALMLQPNRWYRASIAEVSWDTAQELCQSLGGQLVSIETRAEGELMNKLARGRVLWLGGSYEADRWMWTSGAEMIFTNWSANEPARLHADVHPQTIENGAWKVSSSKAGFICEWTE